MIKELILEEILQIISGRLVQRGSTGAINHITTDSRKIISGKDSLYIALEGSKYNGHDFVSAVYQEGIRYFILKEGHLPQEEFPDATILAVSDTVAALQALARWNRQLFGGPVLAIAGSNGKTIVKEWLGQVLGTIHSVAKSPKSYNSQIGVPLSIFGMEAYHKVAILEAGISKAGEMEKLEHMIAPTLGIFTNLGTAHDEGFSDRDEKLKEKLLLFRQSRLIIYRKDQVDIARVLEDTFPAEKLVSWSSSPGAHYTLSVKKDGNRTKILLMQPDLSLNSFETDFSDEASLENLRHVIVGALTLGMPVRDIQEGIRGLKPLEMRLSVKQGLYNSTIIDDTYNNDVAGLEVALEFLSNQRPKRRKILILSDLPQAGDLVRVYQQVCHLIQHYQLDYIYGVGQDIRRLAAYFPQNSLVFEDTNALIQHLNPVDLENDLVLVKGARKYGFESIVNHLQERIHGTTLEINLNALSHNYNFYKGKLRPGTKIMAMVKAFAYGGGSVEIANQLQQLKTDYLAVAYTDEGVLLRNNGIHLPIMVLNPDPQGFHNLLKYQLDPAVYSLEFFEKIGKFCQARDARLNIHLDMDTGMRRLGFEQDHIPALGQLIAKYPQLTINSIYTHLVGADEEVHEDFTLTQLKRFEAMSGLVKGFLNYPVLLHALNSAGILRYPEYQFDMVRLGIGLYGIEVTGLYHKSLRPISTLRTTISQIKHLAKGESIGYGRKGLMEKDGKIATIPIGYADGYDRRFSNGKGYVSVHGQRAKVIGNVCMDMCMVDITEIDARVGDEVIIYGENPSVIDLAENIGTIPYELLTSISDRVKRIYYMD